MVITTTSTGDKLLPLNKQLPDYRLGDGVVFTANRN
jgi:hypothetical protein